MRHNKSRGNNFTYFIHLKEKETILRVKEWTRHEFGWEGAYSLKILFIQNILFRILTKKNNQKGQVDLKYNIRFGYLMSHY